ncbi:MAG TPA: hypothetical protein VGL71_02005, partial [Urbifossiella sp.]
MTLDYISPILTGVGSRRIVPAIPFPPGALRIMLDLHSGTSTDCSGPSRRAFLRVGGLAAFGLTLPTYLRAMAER